MEVKPPVAILEFAEILILGNFVEILILGKGLSTPDLIAGDFVAILFVGSVGMGFINPDFLVILDDAVGACCEVVFSMAISTGCSASTAKGSGRPLATVLDQFSASVGGIKPAATSGETGLIAAAPGVVAAVAGGSVGVGTAAVLVGAAGAAAGAGLVAAAGAGAGASGFLSPSPPQLEVKIAKLLIIPR